MNSYEKVPGFMYFSPAINPVAGSEIDVSEVKFTANILEKYISGQPSDSLRPFLLGPPPAVPSGRVWPPDFSTFYEPKLNETEYCLMNNKPGSTIHGELLNTTTLELTIVIV